MNPRTIESERVFMNTRINIKVFSDEERKVIEGKIEEAFSKFDYVVKKFTRFEDSSELSGLNKQKEAKVSQELFDLIKFELKLAEESDGAFDPTIIDLLETYGYKKGYDFSILDQPEKLKEEIKNIMNTRADFRKVELDEAKLTIKLADKQKLDLGAVGKGYAIDLAAEVLMPLKNFIINAGGDIYAHGHGKDKDFWSAGLQFTDEKGESTIFEKVELKDQALASSGSWARKVKYFHHLIDPKSGNPVQDTLQTFVIAKTATLADAYSTLLFVMGQEGLKILEKEQLEGMAIMNNNQIYKTKHFPFQN
jgi:FAD:protein FMN transferase